MIPTRTAPTTGTPTTGTPTGTPAAGPTAGTTHGCKICSATVVCQVCVGCIRIETKRRRSSRGTASTATAGSIAQPTQPTQPTHSTPTTAGRPLRTTHGTAITPPAVYCPWTVVFPVTLTLRTGEYCPELLCQPFLFFSTPVTTGTAARSPVIAVLTTVTGVRYLSGPWFGFFTVSLSVFIGIASSGVVVVSCGGSVRVGEGGIGGCMGSNVNGCPSMRIHVGGVAHEGERLSAPTAKNVCRCQKWAKSVRSKYFVSVNSCLEHDIEQHAFVLHTTRLANQ